MFLFDFWLIPKFTGRSKPIDHMFVCILFVNSQILFLFDLDPIFHMKINKQI